MNLTVWYHMYIYKYIYITYIYHIYIILYIYIVVLVTRFTHSYIDIYKD